MDLIREARGEARPRGKKQVESKVRDLILLYVRKDESSSASTTTKILLEYLLDPHWQSNAAFISFHSVNGAIFDDDALPQSTAS